MTNVNSVVETEISRFDKVIATMEKQLAVSNEDIRDSHKRFLDENLKWKVDFEEISTKKIQEIHSALKMLNTNQKNQG